MLGAAIRKDVWLLLRDRGALISLFALPVVFIARVRRDVQVRPRQRPAAADRGLARTGDARGEAIAKALARRDGFVALEAASADAVRDAVAHDGVDAGLVVPAEFSPGTGRARRSTRRRRSRCAARSRAR